MRVPRGSWGAPTARPPAARRAVPIADAHRIWHRLGLLVSALLILSAPSSMFAGGHVPSPTPRPSSDGGTPTPTSTPPCDLPTPVPQAVPIRVYSGDLVTLDGSASSGVISGARWTQIAGPRVAITDAESLVASFVAPPVTAQTVVTIVLGLFSPCTPTILVANVDVTVLPPAGVALVALEEVSVVPGEEATLDVRLHTDSPVASVAHALTLDAALAIVPVPDGHPQCAASAEIGTAAAQFDFTPPGCSGEACTGIHVAIAGPDAIPDGALLYSCTVAAAGTSPVSCDYPYDCCAHPLACHAASASGPDAAPVPAECVEGVVRIQYPAPTAEFVFTIDPPEPRVGDLVRVTVDTVPGPHAFIGMPVYSLIGAQPFLIGDTSPQHFTGPRRVTWELRAARAGTAELLIGITFEGRAGCPGNEFYTPDGLSSQTFPLTIGPAACAGDCDADGRVTIDELITGVRMALGDAALTACPAMDGNGSGGIQVDDLVAAVTARLRGCAG